MWQEISICIYSDAGWKRHPMRFLLSELVCKPTFFIKYLADIINAANFLAFWHQYMLGWNVQKKCQSFLCTKGLKSGQPSKSFLHQNQAIYCTKCLILMQQKLWWLATLQPLDAPGWLVLFGTSQPIYKLVWEGQEVCSMYNLCQGL